MSRERYYNYIEGKSIALVGPAEYLTKTKNGKIIDDFDIVVRINRGTELIDRYSDSIGSRTDILYNCLVNSPDNGGNLNVKDYKNRGIKWISTVPGSDSFGNCYSSSLHPMVKLLDIYKMKLFFNFHVMDFRSYASLNKKVNSRANTGFSAIFDLLENRPKLLYITGFSFYLDNFIPGYKNGCSRDEVEFSRQCFISERHKQKPQWELLKNTFKTVENITVDPTLEKILSLDDFSREAAGALI